MSGSSSVSGSRQDQSGSSRVVHPIEAESYRRLRAAVDTSHLPPLTRAVVERMVHASADVDYVGDVVAAEADLVCGARALADGAPVVVDVRMVAAGLVPAVRDRAIVGVDDPAATDEAARRGETRSAAGLRLALDQAGPGAVVVVGCAPTAAFALVDAAPSALPALVVAVPVGFVDAAESKAAVRDAGLPAVTNRGPKGGSAVAAAALNALHHHREEARR